MANEMGRLNIDIVVQQISRKKENGLNVERNMSNSLMKYQKKIGHNK